MKSLLLLTLASLSEEAIIKTIKTEIELLTDVKMIHFHGKSITGTNNKNYLSFRRIN